MSLNRRDLLKTAAIAALPGTFLLDAACGGVSPPEVVPPVSRHLFNSESHDPTQAVHSVFSVSRFTARVDPGYMLVFPCGYSKIVVKARRDTILDVVKQGVFFTVAMSGKNLHEFHECHEFGGACHQFGTGSLEPLEPYPGNPLPKSNMLRIIAKSENYNRHEYKNKYAEREVGQWITATGHLEWGVTALKLCEEDQYWKMIDECVSSCFNYTYAAPVGVLPGRTIPEFLYGRIKRKTA